MRRSESPSPASTPSHVEAGNGRIPATAIAEASGSATSATQRVPPSTAIDRGMPSRSSVRSTAADSIPTRTTVPASGFATQTASSATAMSDTPRASSIAPTVGLEPAATFQSVPSDGDVTQAASVPTAIAPTEDAGTRARATGRAERSSSRATTPSTPSTQTPAGPAATAAARTALERAVTVPVAASIRTIPKSGVTAQTAPSCAATWFSTRFESAPPRLGRRVSARLVPVVVSSRATAVATGPVNCASSSGLPLATQTEPAPAATSVGVAPVENVSTTRDATDRRRIVWASASTTQAAPLCTAIELGVRPAAMRRRRAPLRASNATTAPVVGAAARPARDSSPSRSSAAAATVAASASTSPTAAARPRPRRAGAAGRARAWSPASWARIAFWSRCSSGPGSRPSPSTSSRRASAYTSSASAWRPDR